MYVQKHKSDLPVAFDFTLYQYKNYQIIYNNNVQYALLI